MGSCISCGERGGMGAALYSMPPLSLQWPLGGGGGSRGFPLSPGLLLGLFGMISPLRSQVVPTVDCTSLSAPADGTDSHLLPPLTERSHLSILVGSSGKDSTDTPLLAGKRAAAPPHFLQVGDKQGGGGGGRRGFQVGLGPLQVDPCP